MIIIRIMIKNIKYFKFMVQKKDYLIFKLTIYQQKIFIKLLINFLRFNCLINN